MTTLIYRGSRDGFRRTSFHSNCDLVRNTVTVVLNNLNYVFGGYTSVGFSSSGNYLSDPSAYIFSLRQGNLTTNGEKCTVRDSSTAIYTWSNSGPTFGSYVGSYYCDIAVGLDANYNYADFGASYNLPPNLSYGSNAARSYLAGAYNTWNKTEIEIYRIY